MLLAVFLCHLQVTVCHLNQHWLSNCTQNTRVVGTLSIWQMGWYVTRRDSHCLWSVSEPFLDAQDRWEVHPIACGCNSWVSLCHFLLTPTLKLTQNTRFWYPLSMANEMMYYKEQQPLLMKCFRTWLRYMRQMWSASNNICLPTMGHIVPISPDINSQIAHKIPDVGTLSVDKAKGVFYHTETQP